MTQLRHDYPRFCQLNTEIIVAGPEDADSFRKYWLKEELPFIGLPDPKHTILNLYGQEIKLFKLGRLPALMLIDKFGILQYVHYGDSMADIPVNEEFLRLIMP